MSPLPIRPRQDFAPRRGLSLLALGSLAVLALSEVGNAQFFRVGHMGGNTFGHAPVACFYTVTQALPLTDSTDCANDTHAWSGTSTADRGILCVASFAAYSGFDSLGSEYHNSGQFDQDVVVSGPDGPVTLTLFVDVEYGELENMGPVGMASSLGFATVSLGPISSFQFSSPAKQRLAVTRTVIANTPFKLDIGVTASAYAQGPSNASSAITARFPIGEPVFLLPAGYTANSPELGILDNFWLGPDLCVIPAQTYCTAKVNSQGCLPVIGSSGQASASSSAPFEITAAKVINQKPGLLLYGVSGPAALPFQDGTLCVAFPVKRSAPQTSAGNPPPDDCSGSFAIDFNALIQSGNDPDLVPSAQVHCQYWYRDPQSASKTGLSDGLAFWICP